MAEKENVQVSSLSRMKKNNGNLVMKIIAETDIIMITPGIVHSNFTSTVIQCPLCPTANLEEGISLSPVTFKPRGQRRSKIKFGKYLI